ncbi:DHA2 family efflux MFS transporter permease subunit [Streptomyces hoynatensis]|uniref:DHA2 family efflux MFS transporter permease subunit n=1 Tax=Streptomyces hoynatensis TaxID=1141874 RepID=A0A3A9ZHN3_9ACTN|nr:DHA2 family efflux MFS transporter permease subunit [Streptomyces hoynatensis]RKN47214.1 DHA2 family efflux MFS transporter permease subunit [Streptomyces hoynatensis]
MDPTKTRTPFSPRLRRVIVVTTLGSFLALLDGTIVNVALDSLSAELDAPLGTVQWLVTGYLLAMAAVLPISHWLATRYGPARVYTTAMAAFALSSLACGLAGSAGQLIAFRVVQGAAAAVAGPVGQVIVVRAAGVRLMARVMSVTAIPTIMAPVLGPTVGGLLLQHAGWRWIFLVNVPVGALAVLLARLLLPRDEPQRPGRLDVTGLATLALGCVALTYGLAGIGGDGGPGTGPALGWTAAGAVLLGCFVRHALRAPAPLVDLRLFARGGYVAASLINFLVGALVFGAVILMPLYFQVVRGQDAVATGLLLVPQGLGIAVAFRYAALMTDRAGGGRTALAGVLIGLVGTLPFVFIGAHTPYGWLCAAMVVRGIGIGATMVPAIAVAYRAIPPDRVGDATVQLNVLQRIGGSVSTALFAVVLQRGLDGAATPSAMAGGFGSAFCWVAAISVLAAPPALYLARAERRGPAGPPAEPARAPAAPPPAEPAPPTGAPPTGTPPAGPR